MAAPDRHGLRYSRLQKRDPEALEIAAAKASIRHDKRIGLRQQIVFLVVRHLPHENHLAIQLKRCAEALERREF